MKLIYMFMVIMAVLVSVYCRYNYYGDCRDSNRLCGRNERKNKTHDTII